MAPILRVTSAPSKILKTIFDYIRLNDIHRHPEYDDIIDPDEGEIGGPGGGTGTGPPRSGVFIVIMVFGFVAVVFTIVAGWIWCAAANEPVHSSKRDGRRGAWKTKRMVPFKEWYRRRRGLPHTKSDMTRNLHPSILDSISAANWGGRVNRRGEPDHKYKAWRRSKDAKVWRNHRQLDPNAQFNPNSPLLPVDNRSQWYHTFSKEAGPVGAHILSVPTSPNVEELFTSMPYTPLPVSVPPLRRPPLGSTKGRRTVSMPSRSTPIADRDLRLHRQRSNSWNGYGSSPRGRSWKYPKRGSGDFDGSGNRYSYGGNGRGCSRGVNRIKPRGLDVVEEEPEK